MLDDDDLSDDENNMNDSEDDRYFDLEMDKYRTPDMVLPFLYVGDRLHAMNSDLLKRLGITHVLNVDTRCKFPDPVTCGYSFHHEPISDFGDDDLKTVLPSCFSFMNSIFTSPSSCAAAPVRLPTLVQINGVEKSCYGTVLVHCKSGVNRAPSVVLAWLLQEYGESVFSFFHTKLALLAPFFLVLFSSIIDNS